MEGDQVVRAGQRLTRGQLCAMLALTVLAGALLLFGFRFALPFYGLASHLLREGTTLKGASEIVSFCLALLLSVVLIVAVALSWFFAGQGKGRRAIAVLVVTELCLLVVYQWLGIFVEFLGY